MPVLAKYLFYGDHPLNIDLWSINSQISNMTKIRPIVQALAKRTRTHTHMMELQKKKNNTFSFLGD
jgi:hypothetical protein